MVARGRDLTGEWLALLGLAAWGLLLVAGGGPVGPALAAFGLGVLAAVGLATAYHRAAGLLRARRFRSVERDALLVAADEVRTLAPGLALSLEAIGAPDGTPGRCSLGQTARALRREGVTLVVEHDREVDVPYLAVALEGLIGRGDAEILVRRDCVEVRGGAPAPLAIAVARAVAQRAGGELLVCGETRTILTLR